MYNRKNTIRTCIALCSVLLLSAIDVDAWGPERRSPVAACPHAGRQRTRIFNRFAVNVR